MLVSGLTTVGKTFRVVCAMKDGENFVGWFDVKGNEVTARFNPEELMMGKYFVVERGNAYTLVIQDVVVDDGGDYTCKGDRTERTFTLYVECKYLSMYYQFATFTFPMMQFVFPTIFCVRIVFISSWELVILFEKLKPKVCKILWRKQILLWRLIEKVANALPSTTRRSY